MSYSSKRLSIPIQDPNSNMNRQRLSDSSRRASMARLAVSPNNFNPQIGPTQSNTPNSISNFHNYFKRTQSSSPHSSVFQDDLPSNIPNPHNPTPGNNSKRLSKIPSDTASSKSSSPLNDNNSTIPHYQNQNPNSFSTTPLVQQSPSYGSINNTWEENPALLKNISRHYLPSDSENSLQSPAGDILRDLYTIPNKLAVSNSPSALSINNLNLTNNNPLGLGYNNSPGSGIINPTSGNPAPAPLRRSRSLTGTDVLGERRGSMASQLRVPGGFRRDFIQSKRTKFGHDINQASFLTKNFLEFLSIYGHFAGEDLEDEDFLACDIEDMKSSDEESVLLQRPMTRTVQKEREGTASTMKAFFLLLKSFVGTGVLFLPKAFANGGLLLSIALLLVFGILSYWCYYILILTKEKTGVSSFGDIGLKVYGKPMKVLILMSIVLSQIGFVAAYVVFTAENLRAFLLNVFHVDVSIAFLVFLEALILMPFSLFRNITKLSLAALLANIFILSGIITIVYFASQDLITMGVSPNIKMANKDNWSLFIGVAIFAFEGIGLIIPVQESMKYPEQYPKVLFAVISVCSVLFIGVGSLGYLTYGDKVQTVVILNLPQDSIAVNSIQFFYALAIMLSAPIQLLPAVRIMESRVFKRKSGKSDPWTKWAKNLFRICIVIATTLIAYFGSDNLDQFVSFVGSFACIPLVYMYPPMLHYKACANSKSMKMLNLFLITLGGVALVYTTYQILT